MKYKDYYKILSVSKNATQAEIKRAYKKLARKYHPDVSKELNAEGKFKEVGEAYEVLKDQKKRTAYDQLGSQWQSGQDFKPPPNWDPGFEFTSSGFTPRHGSTFSDFFESLFGHAKSGGFTDIHQSGKRFNSRGEDHQAKILIELEDTFKGTTRIITLHSSDVDSQGHILPHDKNLKVNIPKGIMQGQKIRLSGQGSPGMAGRANGDLYLQVQFKPHAFYRIEGADIYLELPIAPWEAALGAKIKAPTPAGVIDLKIPPDSISGRKLRLKGRGIPAKSPGDLYVVLQIVLPPGSTQQARAIYRKMQQEMDFNPRARLGV